MTHKKYIAPRSDKDVPRWTNLKARTKRIVNFERTVSVVRFLYGLHFTEVQKKTLQYRINTINTIINFIFFGATHAYPRSSLDEMHQTDSCLASPWSCWIDAVSLVWFSTVVWRRCWEQRRLPVDDWDWAPFEHWILRSTFWYVNIGSLVPRVERCHLCYHKQAKNHSHCCSYLVNLMSFICVCLTFIAVYKRFGVVGFTEDKSSSIWDWMHLPKLWTHFEHGFVVPR